MRLPRLPTWAIWFIGLVVCLFGLPLGSAVLINLLAEGQAQAFCDASKPGSTISAALARADQQGLPFHHEGVDGRQHTFVFRGFVMDKAYCDVFFDERGVIQSTQVQFQHD
jgi:hypothetical protein